MSGTFPSKKFYDAQRKLIDKKNKAKFYAQEEFFNSIINEETLQYFIDKAKEFIRLVNAYRSQH